MSEDCFGCIGEIKFHREHFRKVINEAREIAKKENRTVTVYRTEGGDITLEPTGEVHSYVTSHLQNT